MDAEVNALGARLVDWLAPLNDEEGHFDDEYSGFHLADRGHETCWLIRRTDARYTVSRMSRGNGWNIHLSSPDLTDAERYLVDQFGAALRARLMPDAPRIDRHRAWDPETGWGPLGEGYRLTESDVPPRGCLLVRTDDATRPAVAFASQDVAVRFSHIGMVPVEDLKASYLHGSGEPALAVEASPPAPVR